MYLANRGVKAANIPLIFGMPPPPELLAATHPMIVGLTREAKSLSEFRRSRLRSINQDDTAAYADVDRVREEVTESRRLFTRQGWPVIDVTRRSIEEVAAAILQLYAARNERLGAPP
jgi:regulator of PEP synthase PpsR (kinase-PPPase family)